MTNFLRTDLDKLKAYTSHPGGEVTTPVDHLDTNESPYDLPSQLKEKLAWTYQQEIEANRYPDGSHAELKAAISQYVNEYPNTNITPDQISVGNGSDELIRSLLIATCANREGSILVANPTFSMYGIIAQTLGIPVVSVGRETDDFAINLIEAQKAIETVKYPPIRVVFVVHPNSPTANALTDAELDWLRSLPDNILVVVDEAYFEYSQTSVVSELSQHPNWMILRTFSKAFRLAAHRIGYAVASPAIITALEKIRLPYNLPTFSQTAALFALHHRPQILATIEETLQEREKLYQALVSLDSLQVWKSAANFIYLRLKEGNYTQVLQTLKQQGTLIRHTGGGFRITVGSPAENQRTLERIKAFS
jgi:histidinol-phosphate aminotransferase